MRDRFRDDAGRRPSVAKLKPDAQGARVPHRARGDALSRHVGRGAIKRGYRRDAEGAPLRENLAAGLIALSGWTPDAPLLDPMCGSGTIAIEAALIAADRAPGLARTFGFQKLSWFDGPTWQRLRQRAHDRVRPAPASSEIFASDTAATALAHCRGNAAMAGVAGWIEIAQADVLTRAAPAAHGILIANPPYGLRLGDDAALAAFYPKLGDALKQRFPGWTACLLTGDLRLAKLIGLKPSKKTPLFNGNIDCRLFRFEIVAGPHARSARSAQVAAK